jgi:hypothetical protein
MRALFQNATSALRPVNAVARSAALRREQTRCLGNSEVSSRNDLGSAPVAELSTAVSTEQVSRAGIAVTSSSPAARLGGPSTVRRRNRAARRPWFPEIAGTLTRSASPSRAHPLSETGGLSAAIARAPLFAKPRRAPQTWSPACEEPRGGRREPGRQRRCRVLVSQSAAVLLAATTGSARPSTASRAPPHQSVC